MRYGRLLDHAHQTEQKIFSANISLLITGSRHSFFSLAPYYYNFFLLMGCFRCLSPSLHFARTILLLGI